MDLPMHNVDELRSRTPRAKTLSDIIEPIASFYNFLATFPYLPTCDIRVPPATGWPLSDVEKMRKLGKSDFAVEVLSHLPYITEDWDIAWETRSLSYIGPEINAICEALVAEEERNAGGPSQQLMEQYGFHPFYQHLPAHVITLTTATNYGYWLLLDTEAGTIIEYSHLGGESQRIDSAEEEETSGLHWRNFPTTCVKDYLDTWMRKYNALDWMPMQVELGHPGGEIWGEHVSGQDTPKEIRKIYLEYGWGAPAFRKEDCRIALADWREAWMENLLESRSKRSKKIQAEKAAEAGS
ncbi:hypothetical protein BDZ45DRAFT_676825 [Acephala macrosclerotiorum]|nr:hypothetical protein BDZ45DRAFT_676825 [Acephala macrosclerotiorum]